MTNHELTQRAIEAWNAKGDASVEERMEAVIELALADAAATAPSREDVGVLAKRLNGWPGMMRDQQMRGLPERLCADLSEAAHILAKSYGGIAKELERVKAAATPSPTTGERDAVLEGLEFGPMHPKGVPYVLPLCECTVCQRHIGRTG